MIDLLGQRLRLRAVKIHPVHKDVLLLVQRNILFQHHVLRVDRAIKQPAFKRHHDIRRNLHRLAANRRAFQYAAGGIGISDALHLLEEENGLSVGRQAIAAVIEAPEPQRIRIRGQLFRLPLRHGIAVQRCAFFLLLEVFHVVDRLAVRRNIEINHLARKLHRVCCLRAVDVRQIQILVRRQIADFPVCDLERPDIGDNFLAVAVKGNKIRAAAVARLDQRIEPVRVAGAFIQPSVFCIERSAGKRPAQLGLHDLAAGLLEPEGARARISDGKNRPIRREGRVGAAIRRVHLAKQAPVAGFIEINGALLVRLVDFHPDGRAAVVGDSLQFHVRAVLRALRYFFRLLRILFEKIKILLRVDKQRRQRRFRRDGLRILPQPDRLVRVK